MNDKHYVPDNFTLWVLDFNDKAVYNYAVKLHADESEYLKILKDVGHELSKIEWMISPYDEAIDATTDLRVAD